MAPGYLSDSELSPVSTSFFTSSSTSLRSASHGHLDFPRARSATRGK